MAHVAIFTIWKWECPDCGEFYRAWNENGIYRLCGMHLQECETPAPGEWGPEPEQTTWAFNVVGRDVSQGAVTVVPVL